MAGNVSGSGSSGLVIPLAMDTKQLRADVKDAAAYLESLKTDLQKAEERFLASQIRLNHLRDTGRINPEQYEKLHVMNQATLHTESGREAQEQAALAQAEASAKRISDARVYVNMELQRLEQEKAAQAELSAKRLSDARVYAQQEMQRMEAEKSSQDEASAKRLSDAKIYANSEIQRMEAEQASQAEASAKRISDAKIYAQQEIQRQEAEKAAAAEQSAKRLSDARVYVQQELARIETEQSSEAEASAKRLSDAKIYATSEIRRIEQEKEAKQNADNERRSALKMEVTERLNAMRLEGENLKWQFLTEQEKFNLRRQSDIEHLEMLQRAGALTDAEVKKMSMQAGRLGLGNIPGDNNANNKGFQGAMMAQQLGFGLQDFMSQVSNSKNMVDGLGRGIMAVSNNVQMLGSAFGPTGLAVTAIGGALAGIVLPAAIKWLYNTEEIEKETKKIVDHYGVLADRMEAVTRVRMDQPDALIAEARQLEHIALLKEQQARAETQRTAEQRKKHDDLIAEQQRDEAAVKREIERGGMIAHPELNEEALAARNAARKVKFDEMKPEMDAANERINKQQQEAIDARAKLNQLAGDIEIAERRSVELEIRKLLMDQTAEQVLANQKRLEDTRDVLKLEIKLFEQAAADETEVGRKAREQRLSDLKRDAERNAEILATVQRRANAEAAGNRLAEERDRQEKMMLAAEKDMKKMAQAEFEKFVDNKFDDPELRKQDQARERDALAAKQAREEKELARRDRVLPQDQQDAAMKLLKLQQDAERKRLDVKQKEEDISKLSPLNKGAAGVDVNSSEGVSAINRAVSGTRSEQDVQKQQLEELKKIAADMNEQARNAAESIIVQLGQ
jgi:hypothetical protein